MSCIELSGEGEPLLSPYLEGVIECADDCGFITTLVTNGHALTDATARFFFEHNVTLVVSLFSVRSESYENDNRLQGSFAKTLGNIQMAASIYREGTSVVAGSTVLRMATHTTAQADNLADLPEIRALCDELGIFCSIAPLAPVGGGQQMGSLLLDEQRSRLATDIGHNSIILSHTSKQEIGREVCGTCLYGLNIGYEGNLLFDAHAGYEVGDLLGNVRKNPLEVLLQRQRTFTTMMFNNIGGFCPIRDRRWPEFLQGFLEESREGQGALFG